MVMGIGFGILIVIVIFGGVYRVVKVFEIIVFVFVGLYILVVLVIVVMNIIEILSVIVLIVESVFDFKGMVIGMFMGVVMIGVKRGLFFNEVGMGSVFNVVVIVYVIYFVK